MDNTRNALADLAERLKRRIAHHRYVYENQRQDDIKASRIVAELAKVDNRHEGESNSDVLWRCNDCIGKCRAIAEEGTDDGK